MNNKIDLIRNHNSQLFKKIYFFNILNNFQELRHKTF